MKSTARLVDGFQSVVDNGRGHACVLDLPRDKNGSDTGPTALEMSVMGLAGCISTIWAVVAEKSGVRHDDVEVELDAQKPEDAGTVTAVQAVVRVTSDEPEEKLQRILDKTMQLCPVGKLYEQAGISIDTRLLREATQKKVVD